MNDAMRDAAFRAGVWQVIELRAKELKDAAKQELLALEPGDAIAASWNGLGIAKASMTRGRSKLVVTDEAKLLEWLYGMHPSEIISSPNPAYLRQLEQRARELGAVVDQCGEEVPGVELRQGDPYVSVRRQPDAPFAVSQMLSDGRIQLDGIKELNPPAPEPTDRYTQDREAGAL
jgi:hypothetical protein